VKGKLLAAALVATTLAATPILAQQSGSAAAPAAAPAAPPAAMGGHGGPPMMGDGMIGRAMMMGGGMMGPEMMRHRMMMRHMMMVRREPRQWCLDHLARRAGRMAAIGVRLDLTPQQQPLWDKLQGIAKDAEHKAQQLCNGLKPMANATLIERMDRREQFLSLKLSALQTAKPAMQALYAALTPEQRDILDHPHHRP
jgi:LTXXQ motif family protein